MRRPPTPAAVLTIRAPAPWHLPRAIAVHRIGPPPRLAGRVVVDRLGVLHRRYTTRTAPRPRRPRADQRDHAAGACRDRALHQLPRSSTSFSAARTAGFRATSAAYSPSCAPAIAAGAGTAARQCPPDRDARRQQCGLRALGGFSSSTGPSRTSFATSQPSAVLASSKVRARCPALRPARQHADAL